MSWVAAAVVGGSIVGGVLSGKAQKKAASTAADAQTQASQMAIEQQDKQFQALQALLKPYVEAGTGALGAQQTLLGLNGDAAQAQAIGSIKNSSQFNMLQKQGENSILQNAAATGGLRGGNIQGALAQFSPQLLNTLVQQQYANLGGMTALGQNAAAGTGNAGMQNASQISGLLQSQGAANAGSALAAGQANANMYNSFGQGIGTFAGLGGFGSSTAAGAGSMPNVLF